VKHLERHHSVYTATQLFDLVADVERYPDFLPWIINAKVIRRRGATVWTELTMGTRVFHKRFTTIASLEKPHRIQIVSHDSIFECFEQHWTFEPAADLGTDVEYMVDVRFRSHIFQALIGASFSERAKTMVKAYMRRAERLYGSLRQKQKP
jgi:coenzyme Q-binding protein COQ10